MDKQTEELKSKEEPKEESKHHYIQYGKQTLDESDIQAVTEALRENKYLTTGPRVTEFENRVCET